MNEYDKITFSSKSKSKVGGSRFWENETYGGVTIRNQTNSKRDISINEKRYANMTEILTVWNIF